MLGNVGWEVKRYKKERERERERDLIFRFMKNKFSLLRWISRGPITESLVSLARQSTSSSVCRANNGSRVSWRASTRTFLPGYSLRTFAVTLGNVTKNNDSSFLINGLLNSIILRISIVLLRKMRSEKSSEKIEFDISTEGFLARQKLWNEGGLARPRARRLDRFANSVPSLSRCKKQKLARRIPVAR